MNSEATGDTPGDRGRPQKMNAGPSVGIVVLAAGASTRMGTPKQLLQFRNRSLLRNAVGAALASVCRPVIVVLGAHARRLRSEVEGLPVQVVENLRWTEGMGASIRAGLEALDSGPAGPEAVVLMPCDQPLVSSEAIDRLVEAYRSTGRRIAASEYEGTLGTPALFSRTFFRQLAGPESSMGGKQIIACNRSDTWPVSFPEGAVDVDTPKDYETIRFMETKGDALHTAEDIVLRRTPA